MDDIEDLLRARRAEALARLSDLEDLERRIIDASRDDNADDEHDPEGATIAWDRAQTLALVQHTSRELRSIDAAITRIGAGWDGRCASCGTPILHERLLARPTTDRCVSCAGSR